MTSSRPIRVLHLFASLGKGGIETWLMNILRRRPVELEFDFFLNALGGVYEAEAIGYGCRIHHAPPIRNMGKYLRFLEHVLAQHRYDVVHAHGEEFMGDAMKVAARSQVVGRIAHCHNTVLARGKKNLEMKVRSVRFRTLDRLRISRYATDIVACSTDAGRFLVGNRWNKDPRCRPLYCGIPADAFEHTARRTSRKEFRDSHGIPVDAIVVGHVGSMGPTHQKNHLFLLEIFRELAKRDRRYFLCLAGDGPFRLQIEQRIRQNGLLGRTLVSGICDDVPSLMVHGFDVHVLPSLHEGLPLVGLEAVASGLFTVCSDTITKDFTGLLGQRVKAISLAADVAKWADEVEHAAARRIAVSEGVAILRNSPFSIQSSFDKLLEVYQHRLEVGR